MHGGAATSMATSTAITNICAGGGVLVLVLGDSAIGDANGALDQGCLQAAVYLYSSPFKGPFKYLWSLGAGAAHGLAKSHPGLNLP